MAEVKKYQGYGYHGGGRPRSDNRKIYKTVSISGSPEEIQELKDKALREGVSLSRYVIDRLLRKKN